jgi:uncharacterized membrane protein YphA (DoxX/SURF4 family)
MRSSSKVLAFLLVLLSFFVFSHTVSAHEVYVLTPTQIDAAMNTSSFDMMDTMKDNPHEFMLWSFVGITVIALVFLISIFRVLEKWLHPFFVRARRYAPFVARVTIGISFLFAAYFESNYGPELPLAATYGALAPVAVALLYIVGISIILGYYVRIAASVALLMYVIAVWYEGSYMLMYINYLGEIIVLLVLGSHNLSLDAYAKRKKTVFGKWKKLRDYLAPKSFAILRVTFGISLIAASVYAKVIHNNLALETVMQYNLHTLLGFEPHFLVLGSAIVEIVLGLFIILGLEIRFAALFFEFWLLQSLFFFGEAVWPHIILIGIPIALVMYGYDRTSLEGYFLKKKKYEPVL